MKSMSISVDVEPDMYTGNYKGITSGLKILSNLLKKRNIKATLFVTCDCLEKHPKIFKDLKKQGHEIGLHGYRHVRFADLSSKQKEEQIKKSIACFKKYLKIKPKGFRAPQHAIDDKTLDLLEKYKIKYDSSYSPWNFYHMIFSRKMIKFSHNFTSKKIRKIRKNLYEIPIGTFIFPVSALTLRILPKLLLKLFIQAVKLTKTPVFMMHSWDLITLEKSRLYKKCPLDKFTERFELLLDSFKKYKKLEELIPPL